jgi:hypothetical protein
VNTEVKWVKPSAHDFHQSFWLGRSYPPSGLEIVSFVFTEDTLHDPAVRHSFVLHHKGERERVH